MDKNRQAILLMKERKYEEAAKLFNEIIEENPRDPIGYINFGNLLLDIDEKESAERFFLKAIDLDANAATAYYGLGNLHFEQENYQKAQEYFQKALESGLDEADVFYLLGLSLQNQEQFKLALPYLLRATELEPEDIVYLFQYGLSLAQSNIIAEAKTVFTKVVAMDEGHSDAHYNLGVIAAFEDDSEKALEHFNQALAFHPEHYLALNGKKQIEKFLEEN